MAVEKLDSDIKMSDTHDALQRLIKDHLRPYVRKIDVDALYPKEYLQALGKSGRLKSHQFTDQQLLVNDINLIEQTSRTCMTTGFNLWCHMAASTYLRKSGRSHLLEHILPLLEHGELSGGTGLSNPMKFYAGLERLCLKAKRVEGGYIISGQLPAVSNLGPQHAFACIAALDDDRRIMAFVRHDLEGLEQSEKVNFIGLNGSATYSCKFNDVFISDNWIISDDADDHVLKIRATFILYQIPLGLGVIDASIQSMRDASHVQSGCNEYLDTQPDRLQNELASLRERTYELAESIHLDGRWKDVLQLRLDVVKLTMEAVHACMLHCGGSAYVQTSPPSRRLRESYFLANLTPTIKHLEKLTQQ